MMPHGTKTNFNLAGDGRLLLARRRLDALLSDERLQNSGVGILQNKNYDWPQFGGRHSKKASSRFSPSSPGFESQLRNFLSIFFLLNTAQFVTRIVKIEPI